MPFKTPGWWQKDGWTAKALSPVSWIYGAIHGLNYRFTNPYKSSIPVLCVGGVVAGGSGKTPTLHALLGLIRAENLFIHPVILTRGYGGRLKGPTLVDVNRHTHEDVGDESLLHAALAPTIVSKDRAAGAKLAEAMGADVILLDDGLQNNALAKTKSVLVLNADQSIGNGRLIPAGPLREPLDMALAKIDCVIATGGALPFPLEKPVVQAVMMSDFTANPAKTYIGFAGLGHPEKFKRTLLESGCRLVDFKAYPDHYPYTQKDMKNLFDAHKGAVPITTEKDYVRIPSRYRGPVEVFKIHFVFSNPVSVLDTLKGLKSI